MREKYFLVVVRNEIIKKKNLDRPSLAFFFNLHNLSTLQKILKKSNIRTRKNVK